MKGVAEQRQLALRLDRYLKAELKRAGITYQELALRLTEMGLPETEVSVRSKLSRAAFSAVFFVAAMKAIGREVVRLADI